MDRREAEEDPAFAAASVVLGFGHHDGVVARILRCHRAAAGRQVRYLTAGLCRPLHDRSPRAVVSDLTRVDDVVAFHGRSVCRGTIGHGH